MGLCVSGFLVPEVVLGLILWSRKSVLEDEAHRPGLIKWIMIGLAMAWRNLSY